MPFGPSNAQLYAAAAQLIAVSDTLPSALNPAMLACGTVQWRGDLADGVVRQVGQSRSALLALAAQLREQAICWQQLAAVDRYQGITLFGLL